MIKILFCSLLCITMQNAFAQDDFLETPIVKIQAEYNNYIKDPTPENVQKIKDQFELLTPGQKASFQQHKDILDLEEAITSYESSIKNLDDLNSEQVEAIKSHLKSVEESLKDKSSDKILERLSYAKGLSHIGESYSTLEKKCVEQGASDKTLGECDEGNIKELRALLENHVDTKGESTKAIIADHIKKFIPSFKFDDKPKEVEVEVVTPEVAPTVTPEVVITPDVDDQCSQHLQDLIKNIKGNEALVAKMFNVASVKMALSISKDNSTKVTLEEELKSKFKESSGEEKEVSENLKKLYEKYGKEENLQKLSYYKRDTRLTNENSSAMVELYLKKKEERAPSDLTESDAAVVWAMEELRSSKEKSDPNFRIGMSKGNMMNFSSRVYAHLTDFGRSAKREESSKLEEKLGKESEALGKLLQPLLDGLTDEVKKCLASASEYCEIPGQDKSFLDMISGVLGITKEIQKDEAPVVIEPTKEAEIKKEIKCEDTEAYQVSMASYAIALKGGSIELCKSDSTCKTGALSALDAAVKACPESSAQGFLESLK